MHRARLLSIARAAVPESARGYTGHVARFTPAAARCPNCNAAAGLTLTQMQTYGGEPLDPFAPLAPSPSEIETILVLACPNCETFTAMEVPS